MLRPTIYVLFVTVCVGVSAVAQAPDRAVAAGQQAPRARAQQVALPPLFFKETWRQIGRARAIDPNEAVVSSATLELKIYGPCAKETDPDRRLWISGSSESATGPVNLWTGMCTAPVAAALRDKSNYVDLSGLAKIRWVVRTSGFHEVRPLVKLADGTWLVGSHAVSSTSGFLENEVPFLGMRWIRLDIDRVVTVGRYGEAGEASAWAEQPDLRKVDEVGFVDLMPGSGHGAGGWTNVSRVEVYGVPVKR